MIARDGKISCVIVGDANGILIPELDHFPLGKNRLRGLRLVHTHLQNEQLTTDDLTDLALLRLDFIAAIGIKNGLPDKLFTAHLMPQTSKQLYMLGKATIFHSFDLDVHAFVNELESEMKKEQAFLANDKNEKAILISVSSKSANDQQESLNELKELSASSNITILDTVIQRLKKVNPRHLMGIGKIKDVIIDALNKGATLLIFDQDLTPSQYGEILQLTELKVVDRSQLILDIFSTRAHSKDGKVQVELAQLKYRLTHLTGKGISMSRLDGGIGGRGPGEKKLEIDRRRVNERIHFLEHELKSLAKARNQRRQRRIKHALPIISIVGYTNAGKTTLLNTLTKSDMHVEDKLFATLDTASRRLRLPKERDVIITDTVGFIRDLPQHLVTAFKATLEELDDAQLLVHVIDASNPRHQQHIESVNTILKELNIDDKQQIIIYNKIDKLTASDAAEIQAKANSTTLSALDRTTFSGLLSFIEHFFFGTHAK